MKTSIQNELKLLKTEETIFLNFMSENYHIFFNSNIFLKDIQYAVKHFFELKGNSLNYTQVENLTNQFIEHLEKENKLFKIDHKTWKVNFHLDQKEDLEVQNQ
ncbi:hypothetical protein BMS3Abin04_02972 [bacterium BMS3Abin04]|nr:hypothetical protein BMS3Abin04_02972 [bacterium BMS3Abin04]